jgi:8-oxo-dGTP pyrophosphatase MutT (NUDIX family)
MSFIPEFERPRWKLQYGRPARWRHVQPVAAPELRMIRSSQIDGRAHDITLYIENAGRIAVTAKHDYPPGLYRAPSGGLHAGETLEQGARREAIEETGLSIELTSYILCAEVVFEHDTENLRWTTHVFSATTSGGVLAHTDHREIREARWARPDEFIGFDRLMNESPSGGLRYRAALHGEVVRLLPLFRSRDAGR